MLVKMAEMDLAQPLQPIYVDVRYSRLLLVLRWGYLPLGLLNLSCQSYPCVFSVTQLQHEALQTVGWQLWEGAITGTLDKLNRAADASLPPISVIVCTRDRPLSLERCLRSLAQIDYPSYEVVVVDSCSRGSTVADILAGSGFRYVREDRSGLDWARNRGIAEAKYDIIAYIDDDALATPGWLRGIAEGFEDPEVMIVTGMVLPAELETPAQGDFERYGGMSKGFIGYTIRHHELSTRDQFWASNWGVGANMAFRRSLFEVVGEFDIALDVGTPTNGAGDIEFFYRAISAGYTLRYEPAAMVHHVHRRDSAALKRQIYNNGRSFAAYLMTIARNEPRQRIVLFWFAWRWWIWSWLLRRLITGFIRRESETFRFAFTELRGCFSSLLAYRRSRKIAQQLTSGDR